MGTLIVAIIVVALIAVGIIMLVLGKQAKESDSYIQAQRSINNASLEYDKTIRSSKRSTRQ